MKCEGRPATAGQGSGKNKNRSKTRAKMLPGLTLVREWRSSSTGCQVKENTVLPFFIFISQFSFSHL